MSDAVQDESSLYPIRNDLEREQEARLEERWPQLSCQSLWGIH
jgi:hypothetical protein